MEQCMLLTKNYKQWWFTLIENLVNLEIPQVVWPPWWPEYKVQLRLPTSYILKRNIHFVTNQMCSFLQCSLSLALSLSLWETLSKLQILEEPQCISKKIPDINWPRARHWQQKPLTFPLFDKNLILNHKHGRSFWLLRNRLSKPYEFQNLLRYEMHPQLQITNHSCIATRRLETRPSMTFPQLRWKLKHCLCHTF